MEELNGFVKLFRKFKKWGWYQDMVVKTVFIHCLLSASYCDFEWMGVKYTSGQFITGRKRMAKELGISEWQVHRALEKLKSTGEITTSATSKYTVITVNKWLDYQAFERFDENSRTTNRTTSAQQTNNQPHNERTLYKNIKNKKNINNRVLNSAYPNVMNLADLYRESLKKN